MNFPAFFYVILITIALFAESSVSYDPIPILYHPVENIYRISSLSALEEKLSEAAINKPTFSHVLFLCGDTNTSSPRSDFQKILPSMDPNQNVLEQITNCTQKSNLTIMSSLKVPGHYVAIGFEISETALSSVGQNNLPLESLQIGTFGIPIFYNRRKTLFDTGSYCCYATGFYDCYATTHHFNSYNRSFISSNTCDEYKSMTVNNKEITEDLKEIQILFDEQRQDELFIIDFKIPFRDNIVEESSDELHPKQYLVPHRMVPTNDFIYDNERMATCIGSNVVPIWKNISEGPIKRVEEFIQTLADKLYDNTLTVYTLTYRQLEIRYGHVVGGTNVAEHVEIGISRDKIYIGSEYQSLPVPQYFLKIVGYSVPFTTTDYVNNRPQYYMVIVIHNDAFAKSPRICNAKHEPICKQNGWDVTSDEDDDEVIYCCKVTSNGLNHILEEYKFSGEIFNLNDIAIAIRNEDDLPNETEKDDLPNITHDIEKNQQSKKSKRISFFSRSKREQ